jgi:hypothetical protein
MKKDKKQILKVLVGSRAHGLHNEDSDYDYRAVYVNATTEILRIGHKYHGNHWVEGEKEDQTAYEIGHFLKLVTKCNPTALEVLRAPVVDSPKEWVGSETNCFSEVTTEIYFDAGQELRDLFPYVWNPNDAFNAFVGYSSNQRKKMIEKKDNRGPKFACAYLRTLYHLEQLLETGDFTLEVKDEAKKKELLKIRSGDYTSGSVLDLAEAQIERCKILRDKSTQVPDLDKVHEFLMKVRKHYWEL